MSIPASRGDYSLTLPATDWLTADYALDALAFSLREEGWDIAEGEEERDGQHPDWRSWVEFTEDIMRAGEDMMPDRPGSLEEREMWPPSDVTVELFLSDVQWQIVISALNDAATVSGRTENYDEAAGMRAVARDITAELGSQGWQPRAGDIRFPHDE